MRSASPRTGAGLLALLALGGCGDSTQLKNDRAEVQAKRELGSRDAQRVTRANPDVRVTDVALVRDRRSTAIVVDLRSRAERPVTDVPIAVGVRTDRGERRTLNARPGLGWFQTHVPAIAPGGRATWVFRTRRSVPGRGRPFATVGAVDAPAISRARTLPMIAASAQPPGRDSGRRVARVRVENASDVPQPGLQVVAVEAAGGRYVAAGRAAVALLRPRSSATVTVRLTGRARGRSLRLQASPTIFD